jgi:glycosyltransferase involved in cell wall biosynthesis
MISSFLPSEDGLAVYTYKLCKAMAEIRKNVRILVVSNVDSCKDLIERVKVVKALGNPLAYPFKVFRSIAQWSPDVIHCQHEFWLYGRGVLTVMFISMLLLLKALRRPIVLTIHGIVRRQSLTSDYIKKHSSSKHLISLQRTYFLLLIKAMGKLSDRVIVHLDVIKQILIEDYNYSEDKVAVIPHGADPPTVRVDKYAARKKLGLPERSTILLCFGEIRRGKGLESIIEAIAKLRKTMPNVLLLVVGPYLPQNSPESVGYLKELVLMVRNLKIDREIIIKPGFVPEEEVYEVVSASDIMLLPYTDVETIRAPGPIYRAVSCNVPVITSKALMFENVMNSLKLMKLMVDVTDVKELLHAIKIALSNGRDLRRAIPTWEETAEMTLNLYGALTKRHLRKLHCQLSRAKVYFNRV